MTKETPSVIPMTRSGSLTMHSTNFTKHVSLELSRSAFNPSSISVTTATTCTACAGFTCATGSATGAATSSRSGIFATGHLARCSGPPNSLRSAYHRSLHLLSRGSKFSNESSADSRCATLRRELGIALWWAVWTAGRAAGCQPGAAMP